LTVWVAPVIFTVAAVFMELYILCVFFNFKSDRFKLVLSIYGY